MVEYKLEMRHIDHYVFYLQMNKIYKCLCSKVKYTLIVEFGRQILNFYRNLKKQLLVSINFVKAPSSQNKNSHPIAIMLIVNT